MSVATSVQGVIVEILLEGGPMDEEELIYQIGRRRRVRSDEDLEEIKEAIAALGQEGRIEKFGDAWNYVNEPPTADAVEKEEATEPEPDVEIDAEAVTEEQPERQAEEDEGDDDDGDDDPEPPTAEIPLDQTEAPIDYEGREPPKPKPGKVKAALERVQRGELTPLSKVLDEVEAQDAPPPAPAPDPPAAEEPTKEEELVTGDDLLSAVEGLVDDDAEARRDRLVDIVGLASALIKHLDGGGDADLAAPALKGTAIEDKAIYVRLLLDLLRARIHASEDVEDELLDRIERLLDEL